MLMALFHGPHGPFFMARMALFHGKFLVPERRQVESGRTKVFAQFAYNDASIPSPAI